VVDVVQSCNWRVVDVVGTSRWWILAASTVDSTLTAELGQLDATDVVEIFSWRVTDVVETSSWRTTNVVGNANVMGAAPATSALANLGMSINFSQFHATLVKYRFPMSNCVKSRITLVFVIF
jgi:hypothetical protein